MSGSETTPPGWYPDPMGRHEYRWYDGTAWSDSVASGGRQSSDPMQAAPPTAVVGTTEPAKVQHQVTEQAHIAPGAVTGGGTLFTEPVLVVNQRAQLIEVNNEFAIHDAHGNQIGAIRQVGQSAAKKALRVLTKLDQYMTHSLQIIDRDGSVALALTRPAKLVKSKIMVENGQGAPVGEIVQQNAIGKIRFGLIGPGGQVGEVKGENWRAWNFALTDNAGNEVARITKTWEGLAKTMFTTADNYVVQIHTQTDEPLRSLVVAAAVSVDLALKQDDRGFN
ncbi:MAG TPA: phospholipid scramblase-related protein [Acidimicrobiales bacterium]|nr:phospholipid scramblase-related protein [Acidimicrobiales bacterium]